MKQLIITIFLALLVVSCGHSEKEYRIGVSQCSMDRWRQKLNNELETSAYLYDDDIKISFACAYNDDKKQAEQIRKFIKDGVDLLIVSPNQVSTLSAAINEAYDKGIPVVLFDRRSDTQKYTAFIGTDNDVMGNMIGRRIAHQLDGKGNVVEITGLKGSSTSIGRHKGFAEALGDFPDVKVVAVENADWSRSSAERAMEKLLSRNIDIDAVYAHNDNMAYGAYVAAKRLGREKGIKFYGIDGLPGDSGGVRFVRDGILDATCINPTRGDIVMQLAMDILKGEEYDKDNSMQVTLVTDANAEATLIQADELNMQEEQLRALHNKVGKYLSQYTHQQVYMTLFAIITVLSIFTFIVVYRIVNIKKKMAEETVAQKLTFFTNISHELRTPLTLIADPVERLLEEDNLTLQQRSMLKLIRKNVKMMLRLVGEILDLRKIDSGKMTLEPCKFDLSDALKTWLATFDIMAKNCGITLTLDTDDEMMISADIAKVERIVYNLLGNAMKYTKEGGSVKLSAHHIDNGFIEISVEDSGIGIAKENIGKVFDRFYQEKSSESAIGSGIDLAIVKSFAELHGGYVTVDSVEGKGSKFSVFIPADVKDSKNLQTVSQAEVPREYIEEAEESAIAHNEKNAKDLLTDADKMDVQSRPTVLIVDDNEDVRTYLTSLLADTYVVLTACDGKEGLDIAIQKVPDIVVSDVMMPVMDGMEMCRRLKSERSTSHVPVLLLTARTLEEHKLEGYEGGADGYITKPFNGKLLLSRMKNILENRKRLREAVIDGEYDMTTSNDADTKFINEFKRCVREKMSNSDLSVEDVSMALGLSRVQLYRKVKAMTGSTPVEVIRISRLRKARQLLASSHKTVSEISYEVGFSSPSYFTKCFKDYYGKMPKSVD